VGLERKARVELDTAVVGRAAATACDTATTKTGVHCGRFEELRRGDHALITAGVEVIQHIRDVQAEG